MTTKGIRGATTVDNNTEESIREATLELLSEIISKNKIEPDKISHVIFTLTRNLNTAFPAKFARLELGWKDTAMMCFNELEVEGALEKCLRVLVVLNCEDGFEPQFVYLKGAANLR